MLSNIMTRDIMTRNTMNSKAVARVRRLAATLEGHLAVKRPALTRPPRNGNQLLVPVHGLGQRPESGQLPGPPPETSHNKIAMNFNFCLQNIECSLINMGLQKIITKDRHLLLELYKFSSTSYDFCTIPCLDVNPVLRNGAHRRCCQQAVRIALLHLYAVSPAPYSTRIRPAGENFVQVGKCTISTESADPTGLLHVLYTDSSLYRKHTVGPFLRTGFTAKPATV